MNKPPRKTAITWSELHESLLIDLWEENFSALRSAQKNFHIYERMCANLWEAGFSVTWKEVRTKLDNLTKKYKEEVKKQGVSGGAPSKCPNYRKVHRILGGVKSVHFNACSLESLLDNDEITNLSWEYFKSNALSRSSSERLSQPFESESLLNDSSTDDPALLVGMNSSSTSNHKSTMDEAVNSLSDSNGFNDSSLDGPPSKRPRKFNPRDDMTAYEKAMLAATEKRTKEMVRLPKEATEKRTEERVRVAKEANETRTREMVRLAAERNAATIKFQERSLEIMEKLLNKKD